jgi:hypothetical protein
MLISQIPPMLTQLMEASNRALDQRYWNSGQYIRGLERMDSLFPVAAGDVLIVLFPKTEQRMDALKKVMGVVLSQW